MIEIAETGEFTGDRVTDSSQAEEAAATGSFTAVDYLWSILQP